VTRLHRCLTVLALLLSSLSAFAAGDCPAIKSFTVNDVQLGEPVTLSWTLGGGTPTSLILTGHDFPASIALPPGQTSHTYTPVLPGEKHVQLVATSACGTSSAQEKYHVKQCTIDVPVLTVDRTSVAPGETIHASIVLPAGHTATWAVTNGTPSTATGAAIQVIAGAAGQTDIEVFVSRGSSCTVSARATIAVANPCLIVEPLIFAPPQIAAGAVFVVAVPQPDPGTTVTFELRNGTKIFSDPQAILVRAPLTGSAEVDVIITKSATCSRRFTRVIATFACTAKAVVTTEGAGCEAKAVATFTGTPPFQGTWSDGQYFFTNDARIERSVPQSGTYTLIHFSDRNCNGTIEGSATIAWEAARATVSLAGSASCPKLLVTFAGTPPFTATWTDNGETFTTNESTYERPVTQWGFYNVTNVRSAGCPGQTYGPDVYAQPGWLPLPYFQVTDRPEYGSFTCPGLPRTATLQSEIPAGAAVTWTIDNGIILGGQGTRELQFSGTNPGPVTIGARYVTPEGCTSETYTSNFMTVMGTPRILGVTVEPQTIRAGQTALVTFRVEYAPYGLNVNSSLPGDWLEWVSQTAGTVVYRYRSQGALGVATLTATAMNACATSETVNATLTIESGPPMATVVASGDSCATYNAIAFFSGTAPFSGRWSTGATFTTWSNSTGIPIAEPGTYTLVEYADAGGAGEIEGSATFAPWERPHAELAAGGGACDNTIVVTLTGIAPFQLQWSDGMTTWAYGPTHMRNAGSGTYAITSVRDARGCAGTAGAPVTIGANGIQPIAIVLESETACPGGIVNARLSRPLGAGEVAWWSLSGGEMLSETISPTLQFRMTDPYAYIYAFTSVDGQCGIEAPMKFLTTAPPPQSPGISVENHYPVIGGSTLIAVTLDPNTSSWTYTLANGDALELVSSSGSTHTLRYAPVTSGPTTLNVSGSNHCGDTFSGSTPLFPQHVQATATLTSTPHPTCGADVTVTFTGTPPFSGRWSDTNETFTTESTTLTHRVLRSEWLNIFDFTDANGGGWANGIYPEVSTLPYAGMSLADTRICPGGTLTANVAELPEGWELIWTVEGTNAHIVSGQGTQEVVVAGDAPGVFHLSVRYRSAEGCEGNGSGAMLEVLAPMPHPVITMPATSVRVGETFDFNVEFHEARYASLDWSSSNGDAVVNLGQNNMNFPLRLYAQTPGTTTIRAFGVTTCGEAVEASATLEILP
jgi:hypothetical protein